MTTTESSNHAETGPAASTVPGIAAVAAGTVGLVLGPTVLLVFTFGVFVQPLSAAFGWSRPAIAFGSTIIALMVMVISPVQGYLIDRFGTRPVVLSSIPLFAAGLFLMSRMSGDITYFYLLCGLLPWLGLGVWATSYLRAVSTWFDRRLGLAIGITNGGIGIGGALVPIAATYLIGQHGWQAAYAGLAVAVLLVTWPMNFLFLREAPAPMPASAALPGAADEVPFRDILRTRTFRLLLVSFLLLGFVNVGIIVNQVPLLIEGGVSPARAAAAQATFGIAVLVGRFLSGVLLDRMPAPLLMTAVCFGGVAACLMYAAGVSDVALFACPILIGGVLGAEFDVLSYIIKKYFGIVSFGRAYGIVFAVFQFGAAAGATLLPLSLQHLGSYAPGLIAYAAALMVSGACFIWLRPGEMSVLQPARGAGAWT